MAKQKGPNKMIGFIDGKIYYMMNGEYYVRNPSSASKNKINNDPAYSSTKNNAKEFGTATAIGSMFKKSFGSCIDHLSDKDLYRRINGLFNKLIHRGKGEEGKRSVELKANKELFLDFQFKEEVNFNYLFKAPYTLTVDEDRKRIALSIPTFKASSGVSKVQGATHFRIILSVLVFSDYLFDINQNKYLPVEPTINRLCIPEFSDLKSLDGTKDAITLAVQLNVNNMVPDAVGLVTCIAIEFYQESAGRPYLLEMMSCMKIADVF
ncbi:hypothetical protein MYP_3304 [Sporocytophaga myxococcoides]|uniref:Uncharacterized protein n=1 Tax=Sporocytophaga myxococcoides TaxID=153721 RepID=A0A098LGI5_9BACT|nr:hypothetical protein [Sporocytophaga myxococcoides]GAL86075.1 hypothetical protein MYP_3304 [Sporocytophaga myxococcoides]